MFIGREKELSILNHLYESGKFEFLIMYGRRRVGKTEILKEFSKKHKVLFYSAIEKKSNLRDFSKSIFRYYGMNDGMSFTDWNSSFKFISDNSGEEKTVVIIDEFPYIISEDSSVKSILQHAIDHQWKEKNIMLVLCGSSVSFMTNEIMGAKSPLYGRNTSVMEVKPFDYSYVGRFLPGYSPEERMLTYGILGGVPYYISRFEDSKSITQNICDTIVSSSSPLRDEPMTLLKSELREPATYNTILQTIAGGATRLSEIASRSGLRNNEVSAYIKNLMEMRLVDRITPCGRKDGGKTSQYVISDNFFAFWYRFIFSERTRMEMMDSYEFSKEILEDISEYMGPIFEKISLEYLKEEGRKGHLPFVPREIGKWWGTNPRTKVPDDIDILAIDRKKYLFCECKFRNKLFDMKEWNDLLSISDMFLNAEEKYFYVFSKSGFTESVKEESVKYNARLITPGEM